jgi:hypothetical protein
MATAVAIYDGRTMQEFELLMMTTDPVVVARVMAALNDGGEVYARPHRKNATPRVSLRLVDEDHSARDAAEDGATHGE